jgi:DNA gyrase subunit A
MDLEPGDELCWVKHCSAGSDVILVSEQGQALRFIVDQHLRESGRGSGGVRGLKMAPGDQLAGMDVVVPEGQLLVVTEFGMGKRTMLKHYSPHGRGTGGQRILNITKKTGRVASVSVVRGDEELMMISSSGIVIRTELASINKLGPYAQGVIVMNLREGDRVACIGVIDGQNLAVDDHSDLMTPAAPGKNGKNGTAPEGGK